jgi:tRNA 5-methylaminomethyl-2-thiouridine biosynthesis bifunctional protein
VTLAEAAADVATGGSGNRQGVLYARPASGNTNASRFNLAALLFAQRHYGDLWLQPETGNRCGVLHLERDDRERGNQETLAEALHHAPLCRRLDQKTAGEVAGVPLPAGGLWYPGSGWLSPPAVCRQLLAGTDVRRQQAQVSALQRERGGAWLLLDAGGAVCAEADIVVLACATGIRKLEPTKALPVQPVRGQVSSLGLEASDSAGLAGRLRIAICADGYVSPATDDQLSFGASFIPNETSTESRESETEENLQRLRTAVPGLVPESVTAADCTDRAGVRCATPDRLPLVGPVPDHALMEERFALLRKNARAAISAPGAWMPGLYVSAGYGSRGLAYVPLATEWLVAQICGEPPPMDRELGEALNPARFLIRDLKRNRR